MNIRLRLFAVYRDRAGLEEDVLDVPDGARVGEVLDLVRQRYAGLRDLPPRVLAAVNMDYVQPDAVLRDGDELALIPPVAGGSQPWQDRVAVLARPLDAAGLLAETATNAAGAQVLFLGTVRELSQGRDVVSLHYEAYVEMAERKMAEIVAEARGRWPVCRIVAEHRTGQLDLGDVAVAVAVSAPHRDAAFEAGRHIIDTLKAVAPIWKKERYRDGEEWLDPGLPPPA
jgi:MoaE-MoaD fusion protein